MQPGQPEMGSASEYFGAMVAEYDSLIRRTVPRYDEMLERLLCYLPPEGPVTSVDKSRIRSCIES